MRRYSQHSCARRAGSKCGGSLLIEVMLAVALMAVTALGLIAGQLWVARETRSVAMREHAAWIADSVAEAMSAPAVADFAVRQWNARAMPLLPHGEASVVERGGVSTARVTWVSQHGMPREGDMIDKPESCGGVDLPVGSSCVALAFAK